MNESYSAEKHITQLLRTIRFSWSNKDSIQRYSMLYKISKVQNSGKIFLCSRIILYKVSLPESKEYNNQLF